MVSWRLWGTMQVLISILVEPQSKGLGWPAWDAEAICGYCTRFAFGKSTGKPLVWGFSFCFHFPGSRLGTNSLPIVKFTAQVKSYNDVMKELKRAAAAGSTYSEQARKKTHKNKQ